VTAIEKEPSGTGMTSKVMKGSFWVLVGQLLPLISTFIASPFVIRYLGSESYGVLILVGLISGYFSFADFGMSMASTKFGSEAYGKGLPEKEGLVIRTAAVIAFSSCLLIAIPMFVFSDWIVGELLNVPIDLRKTAGVALKITSVAFVFSTVGNVFNTPQLSRMRMDLNVLINAGTKILMTLTTPVVLYLGGGIIEATIVAFVAALVIMIAHILVSGKLLPQLYKRTISKEAARPLLKFGGNVVLYAIGLTLMNNLEKLVLTRLVSVKSLAYYSVAATFAAMTTMFSMAMVQTLIPAFSQMLSPERKEELKSLFSRTVKIGLLGLIPSVMFLLIIAKPFLTLWAGKEFGVESIYPFYILLAGISFNIIVYVPNCVLMASGRSDVFARVFGLEIVPYILVTIFLIHQFGIFGAAMAFAIKETVNSLIFIGYTKKYTGLSYNFKEQLGNFVLGVLVFLPAVLVALCYDNFSLWLLLLIPLSFVAYAWLAWKKIISEEERVWISNRIRKTFKR